MVYSFALVCLFLLFPCYKTQVPSFQKCPNVTTQSNFDASRYLGKWYEQERYYAVFEFAGKCVTAQYSLNSNGTITVLNKQISELTEKDSQIEGLATQEDPNDPAKLTVVFPSLPIQIKAPYWVLGTDYENYAVVWSCYDLKLLTARNAWILTREQTPPDSVIEDAFEVLKKNDISRTYFKETNQKNCTTS